MENLPKERTSGLSTSQLASDVKSLNFIGIVEEGVTMKENEQHSLHILSSEMQSISSPRRNIGSNLSYNQASTSAMTPSRAPTYKLESDVKSGKKQRKISVQKKRAAFKKLRIKVPYIVNALDGDNKENINPNTEQK